MAVSASQIALARHWTFCSPISWSTTVTCIFVPFGFGVFTKACNCGLWYHCVDSPLEQLHL